MLKVRKIFVLEDEPDFLEVLIRHLKVGSDAWDVMGAGSLEEARPLLLEQNWDLILSDLTLPGVSGEALLQELRLLQPHAALVVVTGRTEEDLALRALGLGAQEYLFKGGLTGEILRRAARLALERKRIERELFNTRLVLTAALDSLSACVGLFDEKGRVIATNAAWRRFERGLPYVSGIELGADYMGTLQGLSNLPEVSRAAPAVGILAVIAGIVPTFKLEFPWTHEDGERWYGLTATGFALDGRTHAFVAFNDITRAMETSRELRKNQHLFHILSDHIQDLIGIVDAKGKRLYESPSYSRVLGWTKEELQDMPPLHLLHPEDREGIDAALNAVFKFGRGSQIEYRLRTKDDGYRYFESHSVPVLGPDGVSEAALFSARDVTDRKLAERERDRLAGQLLNAQKLESIGQLAAGIAHEINTPIQYIGDNTRFLRDSFGELVQIISKQRSVFTALDLQTVPAELLREVPRMLADTSFEYLLEEIPKAAEETLEGVDRVAKIIKALKEFSYPMGEDPVLMDVNKAVETTLTVARNEWKYLVDLELDLDPDLPLVPGYPGEFNQVVLNLVVNGVHAIEDVLPERGAEKGLLRVSTWREGDGVIAAVEDNGKGIPETIRTRVFDPFFTTKEVGRGTGQGLSIAHTVMEKHQGRISLKSEVGEGTTFFLWLPLVRKESMAKEVS